MRATRYLARLATVGLVLALLVGLTPAAAMPVRAVSPNVVISQIYGGGGNSGATYKNDYVQLFNRGDTAVSLDGWSVQYASTGGSFTQVTPLSGMLQPGQYFLVQEAAGTGGTLYLPDPDAAGSITMSATGAKVALVNTITPLNCGSSTTPCPSGLTQVVDLVGWDGANLYEGAAAPATTNTTALFRKDNGRQDTDNNANDFVTGAPAPRNSAGFTDASPKVAGTTPAKGGANVAVDANIAVTLSEPVNTTAAWYSISCTASGDHAAAVSGGPTAFTLDPTTDFQNDDVCTIAVYAGQVTDQDTNDPPDNMAADYIWSFKVAPPPVPTFIHDIQGVAHTSPKVGQTLGNVPGIVTALRSSGFYMQDPSPDADDATSEGIYVFTKLAPTVMVGDAVRVAGTVSEYRSAANNLTTTELSEPGVTVVSHNNLLPAPVIIGNGGRIPPTEVIEDDATGDVETSGIFDPQNDGIDFYESMEGMLVQLNNPVAVGPTAVSYGELPVVGDNGGYAGVRTPRGGVVIRPGDFNPERIILDDEIIKRTGGTMPALNVGGALAGAVVGVMDYDFGNFMIELTQKPTVASNGLVPEVTDPAGTNELAVAAFNVENLAPTDPPAKFSRLAGLIVNNLQAPDLIAIEEIQDSTGARDDGVVEAGTTYGMLIDAVQAAGGPTYQYRQIDPVNDEDGGAPGGNIRQGFLFRADRGLAFVDRPGGDSLTGTTVASGPTGVELSYSPGRIDPTNMAFVDSRKPLAGEFVYNGHKLFVIGNHFNSKGGDLPLGGHFQPPVFSSEIQRIQQASIVHDFVQSILAVDANADVIVLGDLNDFQFSNPIMTLKGDILKDLIETLPEGERYSYVYEGNSETLDHTLISNHLFTARPFVYDPVHVNAEFFDQASDHDPQVVRITLNDPPTVSAGGPYVVEKDSSIALTATGADPEGAPLTYAWDLDDNGSFETPGQSVAYVANEEPGIYTVAVQATDNGGLTATGTATVVIYDPAAGFVTGGGWLDMPEGKAPFELAWKYGKDMAVPTGEFVFALPGLSFQGTSYQWLVVSGATAQCQGTGTIEGRTGTYEFDVTTTDGAKPGGSADQLRVVITSDDGTLVYDTGTAALGGGNITVHE